MLPLTIATTTSAKKSRTTIDSPRPISYVARQSRTGD